MTIVKQIMPLVGNWIAVYRDGEVEYTEALIAWAVVADPETPEITWMAGMVVGDNDREGIYCAEDYDTFLRYSHLLM